MFKYCDRCGREIKKGFLCDECDQDLEEHYKSRESDKELRTYANTCVDHLIAIKDSHRDVLMWSEIDAINDICNLVTHNIDNLRRF